MNFPVQIGWQQVILILLAIVGIGLLISSVLSLAIKVREVEELEDEQGNRYKRWKHHRKPRWKRGTSGLVVLLIAVFLLWITFAIQAYLGLTGEIKVAQVRATMVENQPHLMSVDLILYDQNGKVASRHNYQVKGEHWMLKGNIVELASWLNFLGIHSGFKLTQLKGEYEDDELERHAEHTVINLNGGDGDFFKSTYRQGWASPFVKSAYGIAPILPADGQTYDIFASQDAIKPRLASQ